MKNDPSRNMEPRSNDFESVLLADIYNAPMATIKERSKRLRVPVGKVQRAIERLEKRGINDLKRLQKKTVADVAQKFPEVPVSVLAEKLNTSPIQVGQILGQVESPKQIQRREYIRKNPERYERNVKKRVDQERQIDAICNALVEKPFASIQDVRNEFGRRDELVNAALQRLKDEKFDLEFEREILLAEFIEAHPDATTRDAADYFDTNAWRIGQTEGSEVLRKNARKKRAEPPPPTSSSGEDWPCNSEIDRDMEARCCVRPEWYVCDVEQRKCLGVNLPEEEFKLYLELREQKRRRPNLANPPMCLAAEPVKRGPKPKKFLCED